MTHFLYLSYSTNNTFFTHFKISYHMIFSYSRTFNFKIYTKLSKDKTRKNNNQSLPNSLTPQKTPQTLPTLSPQTCSSYHPPKSTCTIRCSYTHTSGVCTTCKYSRSCYCSHWLCLLSPNLPHCRNAARPHCLSESRASVAIRWTCVCWWARRWRSVIGSLRSIFRCRSCPTVPNWNRRWSCRIMWGRLWECSGCCRTCRGISLLKSCAQMRGTAAISWRFWVWKICITWWKLLGYWQFCCPWNLLAVPRWCHCFISWVSRVAFKFWVL